MRKDLILAEDFVITMIRPNSEPFNTNRRSYQQCINMVVNFEHYDREGYEFYITEVEL